MRHSVLGLGASASMALCGSLASADFPTDIDTGPVYVGPGRDPVIHRRGKFKPNQRKQRAGKK